MALPPDLLGELSNLSPAEQEQLYQYLSGLEQSRTVDKARTGFLDFVRAVWPSFIMGRHHQMIAQAFEDVARGRLKRLIINLPPRHSKSELSSYMFPAWFLGQYPGKKIIQASNTAELAVSFGRKVRNLVRSPEYQRIFPGTKLTPDSTAAGRWNTSARGEYFAIGVGGTISGRGGDLYIIDDPHSEKEAMMAPFDPDIFDKAYEWFTSGPRQRLQPGAAIIIIMTRWGARDLTGQVLKNSLHKGGTEWKVLELPAILPSGAPLWPEFWPIDELLSVKADLPPQKWSAQYQQKPISDDVALIKPRSWRRWNKNHYPKLDYIIQSWDTALLTTERSNDSACTTWGVFDTTETEPMEHWSDKDPDKVPPSPEAPLPKNQAIVLLDAFTGKLDFVELKRKAKQLYQQWKPDTLVIEAKAAGSPLIYELRAMGLPVSEFTPTRGQTKLARVNAVADMFSSGFIWAPNSQFADDVIQQFAEFPHGDSDDLVDSSTQALLRFRAGGFVKTRSDYDFNPKFKFTEDPAREYY